MSYVDSYFKCSGNFMWWNRNRKFHSNSHIYTHRHFKIITSLPQQVCPIRPPLLPSVSFVQSQKLISSLNKIKETRINPCSTILLMKPIIPQQLYKLRIVWEVLGFRKATVEISMHISTTEDDINTFSRNVWHHSRRDEAPHPRSG